MTMTRLTPTEFHTQLGFHINGTTHYYKHPFFRDTVYTTGVKFLADNGGTHGAYWLLDQLLPLCKTHLSPKQPFIAIKVTVADEKAVIAISDGDETIMESVEIEYTDLQEGIYTMFATYEKPYNVLLLASEY
jgi:hypothetical protein